MQRVTVEEFGREPLQYLNQVEAGETFVIVQADKAIAELKPNNLTIATVDPEILKYSVSVI